MSIDEQINLLKSTTCFSNMTTRFSEPKFKLKRSFHDSIKNNKEYIFELYSKNSIYKDLMPSFSKNKRGIYYYNKMFKGNAKSPKKSAFFEGIIKAIDDIHKKEEKEQRPKIPKFTYRRLYAVPKIEILKEKKQKFESYLSKKMKTFDNNIKPLRKSKSMLNQFNQEHSEKMFLKSVKNFQKNNFNNLTSTSNINEPIFSSETLQTFNQNNESSKQNNLKELSNFNLTKLSLSVRPKRTYDTITKKTNRKSIDLSEYFQKQERFMYQKGKRMKKILNKCEENITEAQNVNKLIEKSSKQKDPFSLLNKFKTAMQTYDQKVIEDMDKGNKKYQEYKRIQEQKFNTLKKNMDIKVSDKYAYMIRNELQDTFGVNGNNIVPYGLYQKDMEKIKNKIENNLQIEKQNIMKVNDLLDDVIRKKEFLKYQINMFKKRQDKFNEVKSKNFKKKNDFESKNYSSEDLKGNFLPKLLEIRDQCYGTMDFDFNKQ